MRNNVEADSASSSRASSPWPDPWRMGLIALCALILCSCRGPATQFTDSQVYPPAGLPESAYTGAPAIGAEGAVCPPVGPPGMEQGVPLPYQVTGPWAPPGISQPWPANEYLRDGGDRGRPARVANDWEVRGLEVEDTVAHFDTVDGRTLVEPSNRVHIYAPRFGAVRQVVSLVASEQHDLAAGVHVPLVPAGPQSTQVVVASKQNIQPEGQIGRKPPVIFRSKQGDGLMSHAVKARGFHDGFLPHERFSAIRMGVMETAEMAFLARGAQAALVWSKDQAPQVILDATTAMAEVGDQSVESLHTVKEPPGCPTLRVIKVASTQTAEPGDEVAFTIRFDNVGNQVIGNVTIIDNLTTRLEYVPDSAQCSLDAEFFTQPNEGQSLVIRCEVADPLEPGEGGILRFTCKVR